MRLFVIMSPTGRRGTKTEYTMFRKFLVSDGYIQIAADVYMRIAANRKALEKHRIRLKNIAPSTGVIRVFSLTEKQFGNILYLTGVIDEQEKVIGANSIIML